MTTNNPNVGDPNPAGAGGNQPPVSPEQGQSIAGVPQGSQEVLELRKSYERLERELKGLQSRQDKGQNEVQSFMAEVKQQMAKGKSLEEAEAAVNESREAQAKSDLLLKMARKLGVLDDVSQTSPAGNGGPVTSTAAKAVINELQLDGNAPEVVSILAKGLDPDRQELELRRFAARPRSTPDAASASTFTASPAPATNKAAEIERGYLEELATVPRGNTHKVSMVKAKWRKAAREAGFQLNV